jgi:hypothetical protein
MPTQLPTKTTCLNCDFEVKTENKYCPNCGQENADKRISVFFLLKDAFETVFNFESRVFKTIPYFLFYPGRLTNEFLAGKRVRYMHPFKIYLLSSIVFFFVIIKLFTPALEDSLRKLDEKSKELDGDIISKNKEKRNIDEFTEGIKEGLNGEENIPYDSTSSELVAKFQKRRAILKDSVSQIITKIRIGQLNDSTIDIDSLENLLKDSVALAETIQLLNETAKDENKGFRRFFRLIGDRSMTPDALLDSLGNAKKDVLTIRLAEQILKIGRNDKAIFLANIINNIGTLMFITLPLLALFFVPFYIRRKKYYIDHLIFTLHLQSFTFVILTLSAICLHWDLYSLSLILLVLLMVYVWFAFKKVYKQGFFKTTIKVCIISTLYSITLTFMLSINLVYSILMF